MGEVLNGMNFPVFNVRVIGSFFDSSNNLVGAQETLTLLPRIATELSSPFKLQANNSAGNIDHYELTLAWDDISIVDQQELTINSQQERKDGGLTIVGELQNGGSVSVKDVVVVVTFYNDAGEVMDVYQGSVNKSTLAPEETAEYTIPITRTDLSYTRFTVQAQGALQLF